MVVSEWSQLWRRHLRIGRWKGAHFASGVEEDLREQEEAAHLGRIQLAGNVVSPDVARPGERRLVLSCF
jgi:hypothetical protein